MHHTLVNYLPWLQHLGPEGYFIIFIISFFESLIFTGSFVPGTVVVIISGGFASQGFYDVWLLILASSVGAIVGDSISYELGRKGQLHFEKRPFLKKHIGRAKSFFKNHQRKSIILGRFIGPIRPFIPFIAGVSDMPRPYYYLMCIISGTAWSVFYIGLGYVFGTAWRAALMWSSRAATFAILLAAIFVIAGYLWRKETEQK